MCAVDEWRVDDLRRRAPAPRTSPSSRDDVFERGLDLLSGRYPSDEFAELRPRLVWDRTTASSRAREGAGAARHHERRHDPRPRALRRVPARRHARRRARRGDGLREPARRGVRARRVGWRIEDITRDRVVVSPAPGEPGKMPFWKGDKPGPPARARAARSARSRASCASRDRARRPRAPARRRRPRRAGPRRTWSRTSTTSARRPAPSPTTARSSSNASATRSATGGSASSRRSASACTRRGAWRSRPAAERFGPGARCCGATTAS